MGWMSFFSVNALIDYEIDEECGRPYKVEGAALERAIRRSIVIEELDIKLSWIIILAAPKEVVGVCGGQERGGIGGSALAL